jgi:5-(carboxyamino)imidazole ribonucleotide mutase
MVDANTHWPVITCPPLSTTFSGADIYSSLRMPSGVAPLVVLDPEGAALAAAKMLALEDPNIRQRVKNVQAEMTESVVAADASLGEPGPA